MYKKERIQKLFLIYVNDIKDKNGMNIFLQI